MLQHPLMPGLRAKQMKTLDEHNKQQAWTEFKHRQRLHEQAANLESELTRLATQHNALMNGVMGQEPEYLAKRQAQLKHVRQKIQSTNK